MSRISKALCTRRVLPLALLVLLLSAPAAALGGDWRLTPRFTVQETFTDNVAQTEVDPQDDFITELTPGISLRGRSRRLSSNVDYNFRRNIYANNPRLDDSNHQLQGRSDLEVIEDHVFVEANSTISQQLLNSQGFVSRNQRSRNGNRQDATRYEVSPRFRERFGSWATAEFRYSFDSVSFSADPNNNAAGVPLANPGNDTDQDEYSFDLNSGRKFARTPMSLTWDRRVNESGQGTDVFESLRGRIGYNVNRLLQLNFTA
ncbi:MAG: TIGR03016 family PEP-CTERM system-associated outer membrane protein, partial [Gammaproteobacteria bacterium]